MSKTLASQKALNKVLADAEGVAVETESFADKKCLDGISDGWIPRSHKELSSARVFCFLPDFIVTYMDGGVDCDC